MFSFSFFTLLCEKSALFCAYRLGVHQAAFKYLESALDSVRNAVEFPVSFAFMQRLKKNGSVYHFHIALPFFLWYHISHISQRDKPDWFSKNMHWSHIDWRTPWISSPAAGTVCIVDHWVIMQPSITWCLTVYRDSGIRSSLGVSMSYDASIDDEQSFSLVFLNNFIVGVVISICVRA